MRSHFQEPSKQVLAERAQRDQSCGYSQDCVPPSSLPPFSPAACSLESYRAAPDEDQFSLGVGGRKRCRQAGI